MSVNQIVEVIYIPLYALHVYIEYV